MKRDRLKFVQILGIIFVLSKISVQSNCCEFFDDLIDNSEVWNYARWLVATYYYSYTLVLMICDWNYRYEILTYLGIHLRISEVVVMSLWIYYAHNRIYSMRFAVIVSWLLSYFYACYTVVKFLFFVIIPSFKKLIDFICHFGISLVFWDLRDCRFKW